MRHPNIIHMEDVFESDAKIHMVMEIMQGGELFDYVVEKGTLSESEASVMVRKVSSKLASLCGGGYPTHQQELAVCQAKLGHFCLSTVYFIPGRVRWV